MECPNCEENKGEEDEESIKYNGMCRKCLYQELREMRKTGE